MAFPIAAHAATAKSNWKFVDSVPPKYHCTYGRAVVSNTKKQGISSTRSTARGGAGGCNANNDLRNLPPGYMGGEAYLVRASNDHLCGHAGPVYGGGSPHVVRANRLKISACPGSSGAAYHAIAYSSVWTGSYYHSKSNLSPNLNFN